MSCPATDGLCRQLDTFSPSQPEESLPEVPMVNVFPEPVRP